ncbi:MAG: hypothetical protein V8S24_10495 [Gordonibacter pamelaeae]
MVRISLCFYCCEFIIMKDCPTQHEALIDHYLEIILEANETTNLTRISSLEEARKLHIEDSLAGLQELQQAPEGLYGDLGRVAVSLECRLQSSPVGKRCLWIRFERKWLSSVAILSDYGFK